MPKPISEHEQHLRAWAEADPERRTPYVERALRAAEAKRRDLQ